MAVRPDVNGILGELRRRFEALYGERLVRMALFGSQARGDAEPGSDIDVLVVLKGSVSPCDEIERTSEIVEDLCLRFNAVICCVFMDEDRYVHRNGPLLRNVRREGTLILVDVGAQPPRLPGPSSSGLVRPRTDADARVEARGRLRHHSPSGPRSARRL